MLLSIVVPSRNQGRFIGSTLESILAQAYRPLEIIVVDGASTDGTREILQRMSAERPELRWISEPDSGPAEAVNKGLALARGEIAGIQSSDDTYVHGSFEAVVEAFRSDPGCGLVIGDMQGLDEGGHVLFTERLPEFSWEAYFGRSLRIPQSSIFFRTALAREIGGWNARYFCCDLDFWLRVMLRTRVLHVPRVLSGWRIHEGQRTTARHNAEIWDGYWRMIADCTELRSAPARVQRLARASRHLMAPRHHPTRDPWAVRWHLTMALLQFPTCWRHYPWPLLPWFPGVRLWRKLRRRAGRIYRRITRQRRT